MAQITVRNIDDDVKARLQQRATAHGTSLAAELRQILRDAVKHDEEQVALGFGSRVAARFAKVGLTEPLPELCGQVARPAKWEA